MYNWQLNSFTNKIFFQTLLEEYKGIEEYDFDTNNREVLGYLWTEEWRRRIRDSNISIHGEGTNMTTDSYRDGWNIRNGSNVPKILHSVGERVDCVFLLVLVVLLSKHICDFILKKKHCKSLCWGKYMNLLMLLWKTSCVGCL